MKYASLFLALIIISCVPVEQAPGEQPPVDLSPPPEPIQPEEPTLTEQIEEEVPLLGRDPNPDVVKLSQNIGKVKSYSFHVTELPEVTSNKYYHVNGRKAKVELVAPRQMNGFSADYVFVDYDLGSAAGYCLELSGCKDNKMKGGVPFEEFDIVLPMAWLDEVKYGTRVGSLQYNSRQVAVVRWENEGYFYEAYLDSFYGMPQRVSIASDADRSQIIGGYEYQDMSFNDVPQSEVQPPY